MPPFFAFLHFRQSKPRAGSKGNRSPYAPQTPSVGRFLKFTWKKTPVPSGLLTAMTDPWNGLSALALKCATATAGGLFVMTGASPSLPVTAEGPPASPQGAARIPRGRMAHAVKAPDLSCFFIFPALCLLVSRVGGAVLWPVFPDSLVPWFRRADWTPNQPRPCSQSLAVRTRRPGTSIRGCVRKPSPKPFAAAQTRRARTVEVNISLLSGSKFPRGFV